MTWCTLESYMDVNKWDKYKSTTVFHPLRGAYSYLDFALVEGCQIYPASDFLPASFYGRAAAETTPQTPKDAIIARLNEIKNSSPIEDYRLAMDHAIRVVNHLL